MPFQHCSTLYKCTKLLSLTTKFESMADLNSTGTELCFISVRLDIMGSQTKINVAVA